jgi:hypothetical protein
MANKAIDAQLVDEVCPLDVIGPRLNDLIDGVNS